MARPKAKKKAATESKDSFDPNVTVRESKSDEGDSTDDKPSSGAKPRLSHEKKVQAVALYRRGEHTYKEVAAKFGTQAQNVMNWCKNPKYKMAASDSVASAKPAASLKSKPVATDAPTTGMDVATLQQIIVEQAIEIRQLKARLAGN